MSLGRFGQGNKILVYDSVYGDAGGTPVTQVLFQQDNQGINPFGFCPGVPRAMKCTKVHVTSQVAAVNTAGNWTLRLRKNESFAVDEATFSFAAGTTLSKDAGNWSTEAVFQAGDTWYVVADGPSRNTVLIRASLEWEII